MASGCFASTTAIGTAILDVGKWLGCHGSATREDSTGMHLHCMLALAGASIACLYIDLYVCVTRWEDRQYIMYPSIVLAAAMLQLFCMLLGCSGLFRILQVVFFNSKPTHPIHRSSLATVLL